MNRGERQHREQRAWRRRSAAAGWPGKHPGKTSGRPCRAACCGNVRRWTGEPTPQERLGLRDASEAVLEYLSDHDVWGRSHDVHDEDECDHDWVYTVGPGRTIDWQPYGLVEIPHDVTVVECRTCGDHMLDEIAEKAIDRRARFLAACERSEATHAETYRKLAL
jgi:hypothetical protein